MCQDASYHKEAMRDVWWYQQGSRQVPRLLVVFLSVLVHPLRLFPYGTKVPYVREVMYDPCAPFKRPLSRFPTKFLADIGLRLIPKPVTSEGPGHKETGLD